MLRNLILNRATLCNYTNNVEADGLAVKTSRTAGSETFIADWFESKIYELSQVIFLPLHWEIGT